MKKLMTSTIIVLPLLLLAILLISGAILSFITYTYVESVDFAKKDAVVLLMDDEENPPTRDLKKEINIFPVNAKNHDLIYTSSDENVATVNEEGVVTPIFYGQAYITVQSKENLAAVAKRKIIVTGTTVHSFVMNEYDADMIVGDSAQLSVSILPVDALNKAQKWESSNPDVLRVNANGTVTAVGIGQATITVKSQGNDKITASATITCHNKVQDGFNVNYFGTSLQDGKTYKTLLDSLTFDVSNDRKDVMYEINHSGQWKSVENGKLTVDTAKVNAIAFKSAEETIAFNLEKMEVQDFGFDIFATLDTDNGAQRMLLDSIEQANEKSEILLMLAKNVQDCFTLEVNLGEDVLGGFGLGDEADQKLAEMFALDLDDVEGWEVSYDGLTKQIIISFAGLSDFEKELTLNALGNEIALKLKRVSISQVNFTNETESFDSTNTTDVYKGLQQVRVFAKHSYYGIGDEGKQVDYYKIPFKAVGNIATGTNASLDTVTWKLSRYVGNENKGVLTYQLGDTVTVGNKTYKIVKDGEEYVLKDSENLDGEAVSGKDGLNSAGIIWVDAYSEPGYARIYFGNFAGLSESDVYNDYFGNFDDRQTWSVPNKAVDKKNVDGVGGVEIEPSENAYAFLRIQAGDGAVGGVNCHFNFNVLQDDELVNVFNATGFYANRKMVLHNTLYGVGELDVENLPDEQNQPKQEALAKDLFLTQTTSGLSNDKTLLGRDTIYGNGYAINFQVKNTEIKNGQGQNSNTINHSTSIYINKLFNVTVQGCNKQDEVNASLQKNVIRFEFAYYCDIMSYSKAGVISVDKPAYIKNSIMRYAAYSAFQIYASHKKNNDATDDAFIGEKAYFENVSIVECMMGFAQEMASGSIPKMHYYMKGHNDILTYTNGVDLLTKLGQEKYVSQVPLVIGVLPDYFEYFGRTRNPESSTQSFCNMTTYCGQQYTDENAMMYWDDATQSYSKKVTDTSDTELSQVNFGFVPILVPELNNLAVFVYKDYKNDGTSNSVRGANKLLTDDKYIRLLCQYIDVDSSESGIANTEHIRWHMEQAYRDTSLIEGRISDHMTHLKSTLMNKGIEWPDKTHPEDDWVKETPAEVATLPERKRVLAA